MSSASTKLRYYAHAPPTSSHRQPPPVSPPPPGVFLTFFFTFSFSLQRARKGHARAKEISRSGAGASQRPAGYDRRGLSVSSECPPGGGQPGASPWALLVPPCVVFFSVFFSCFKAAVGWCGGDLRRAKTLSTKRRANKYITKKLRKKNTQFLSASFVFCTPKPLYRFCSCTLYYSQAFGGRGGGRKERGVGGCLS